MFNPCEHRRTRLSRLLARAAWCLAFALPCGPQSAWAQSDTESGPNYAFSTLLGSGLYKSEESTVQVYRLGFGIDLRSLEDRRWGLELRFPLTMGFYDFGLTSVLDSGLPDGVSTLTLAPELRFEIPVGERWRLMPFGALGVGRDFSAGRMNYLAAAGIRSRFSFGWRDVSFTAGNRFFYAAFATSEVAFGDDFGALESGLDARHPLGFSVAGHPVDAGLFFMDYLYFESPNLVRFFGEPLSVDQQWEFGVTLGTMTPWRVLGLEMPRIGAAYRFGSGASTLRILFGGPFN